MKAALTSPFLTLVCALVIIGAGGCTAVGERLQLRSFAQEYQYTQDRATASRAARQALRDMGFENEIGNEDSERFDMVSRTLPGDAAQTRLQRRAKVSVQWTSEGTSLVQIGFWNESEDPSGSESVPASGRLIKEGALYDAFWQRMDAALPPDSAVLSDDERPASAP